MLYLRQSTASQAVLLGPFVDSTDGVTAETGLTIANTDIRISANGGNMVAKNSGGGTHDENGWYAITLDATDTATVGRLQVSCVVSGALPVFMECQVLEEAVYDALFAASADGVNATAVRAALGMASADLDTQLDAIVEDTGTTLPATLATIDGIVDDILLDTAEIGVAGAGLTEAGGTGDHLTAVAWNASWDAEVQSEVQDAIEANHLDHLFAVDYDPASKPGVATALLNELVESDAGVSRFTTNALENAPGGGGGVNVTQINGTSIAGTGAQVATAFEHFFNVVTPSKTINDCGVAGAGLSAEDVWTYATRTLTANTNLNDLDAAGIRAAVGLAAANLDTQLSTIDGVVDDILVDTGTTIPALFPPNFSVFSLTPTTGRVTVNTNLDKTGYSISGTLTTLDALDTAQDSQHAATQAAITSLPADTADAVWNELQADHVAAGSFGEIATEIAAILVDTDSSLPMLINDVDSDLMSVASNVGAILVDTDTTIPAALSAIDAAATAILTDTDVTIPGLIAALNDLSAAEVNAEVVDALATDTYVEPTGVPAATATLADKLSFLYEALRNQITITADKKTFYNDSGVAQWEKDLSDNGTTYTETEANAI